MWSEESEGGLGVPHRTEQDDEWFFLRLNLVGLYSLLRRRPNVWNLLSCKMSSYFSTLVRNVLIGGIWKDTQRESYKKTRKSSFKKFFNRYIPWSEVSHNTLYWHHILLLSFIPINIKINYSFFFGKDYTFSKRDVGPNQTNSLSVHTLDGVLFSHSGVPVPTHTLWVRTQLESTDCRSLVLIVTWVCLTNSINFS